MAARSTQGQPKQHDTTLTKPVNVTPVGGSRCQTMSMLRFYILSSILFLQISHGTKNVTIDVDTTFGISKEGINKAVDYAR